MMRGFGGPGLPTPTRFALNIWVPVGIYGLATAGVLAGLSIPRWRRRLRWRVPAFKEAALAQLAASMALMLEQGCTADQALALLTQLHADDPLRPEMEQWRARLAAGQRTFSDLAAGGKLVPPLFVWLVASSGEDWVAGFKQAAELFHSRAMHRLEMMLYAVLPASVLALGFLIVCQIVPVTRTLLDLMSAFGGIDGADGGS
jgi:type II secretory pathway component PulF